MMTLEREKELRDRIATESWRTTYQADKTYMFTNDVVIECLDAIMEMRGRIEELERDRSTLITNSIKCKAENERLRAVVRSGIEGVAAVQSELQDALDAEER